MRTLRPTNPAYSSLRISILGLPVFLVAALLFAATGAVGQVPARSHGEPFIIPGRLVVEFDLHVSEPIARQAPGAALTGIASVDQILQERGSTGIEKSFPDRTRAAANNVHEERMANTYHLTFRKDADLEVIRADLLRDRNIREVQFVWALPLERTPDDPNFGSQWHSTKLQATAAWDLETGSDNIIIAIIDSGTNFKHPDLEANIWVNPDEDLDGDGAVFDDDDANGVSDDVNGFIDDFVGWDFFNGGFIVADGEDGGLRDNNPNDFDGHGTAVAGAAAAVTNNATNGNGIAGGWESDHRSYRGPRIMCLRAGAQAEDGLGYMISSDVSAAINYAVQNGADIINMSFGTQGVSTAALTAAAAAGVTLIHAAGNESCDCPEDVDVFFDEHVVTVAATNELDQATWFTNYGDWIDISAPGQNIFSTISTAYVPGTGLVAGTSFAAPIVAGVAALIRSTNLTMSKQFADSVLIEAADNIDAQNPGLIDSLGSGRVNAYKAVNQLPLARFTSDGSDGLVPHEVSFTDLSPNNPIGWDWDFGDGAVSTDQDPVHTYTVPGLYDVTLTVQDDFGEGQRKLQRYVWAQADSLWFEDVQADPGTTARIAVYLANTAPIGEIRLAITMPNDQDLNPWPLITEGTRSAGFNSVAFVAYDSPKKQYEIVMEPSANGGSTVLPTGSGVLLYIDVAIPASAPASTIVTIDTATFDSGNRTTRFDTPLGSYFPPAYESGTLSLGACCVGLTGNVDMSPDGVVDLADILYMASALFLGGPPLPCRAAANASGDPECTLDLVDILTIAASAFLGGPDPAPCDHDACGY